MACISGNASTFHPTPRRLACAALAIALLPAAAMAQNRRAGGGGPGGGGLAGVAMGGVVGPGELRQALDEMSLTGDEKTKVDAIVEKEQSDVRQAMQGMRDATPDERQDKLKDMLKMVADAKTRVEAELTPDQKAELAKKLAALSVARATAGVAAEKNKVGETHLPADQEKELDELFNATTKTLDGCKADADAAKDDAAASAVSDKVQRAFQDMNRQVVAILGQDDGRPVVQAGRQAMMRGAGGAAAGRAGGAGARRRAAASNPA